jgi:thiamine-monophosphate kinase
MKYLSEFGERKLIKHITQRIKSSPKNILGTIDDASVYDIGINNEYLVVSTDRIAFPYGLKYGIGGYKDLGKYFASSVINDLIAKGAKPFAFLQAIGLPSNMHINDLDQFIDGVTEILDRYEIEIIGGDTKEIKRSDIDVVGTGIGWTIKRKYFPRSGAKVGDIIAVTGQLGLFSAICTRH